MGAERVPSSVGRGDVRLTRALGAEGSQCRATVNGKHMGVAMHQRSAALAVDAIALERSHETAMLPPGHTE